MSEAARPRGRRIQGYDVARALAIVGMVIVNFKIVMGADHAGPDWLVSFAELFVGRAVATFVILAGVGIALMTRPARESGDPSELRADRHTLLRRAAFLFVVGLLYTPLWPADILHFYGVYIAIAAFVFARSSRFLGAFAGALIVGFVALLFVFDYETGWDFETLEYSGFWTVPGMFRHLFFNGFHPVVPWLAFLLIGLIIGRMDLTDRAERRRVICWGLGAAVPAELVSRLSLSALLPTTPPQQVSDLIAILGTEPMPPMPLYMLAGGGTAVVVIALCVGLAERFAGAAWLRPIVSMGQLSLTLYVAHVVVGMGTLESMGRLEDQTLATALIASGVFSIAGLGLRAPLAVTLPAGPSRGRDATRLT